MFQFDSGHGQDLKVEDVKYLRISESFFRIIFENQISKSFFRIIVLNHILDFFLNHILESYFRIKSNPTLNKFRIQFKIPTWSYEKSDTPLLRLEPDTPVLRPNPVLRKTWHTWKHNCCAKNFKMFSTAVKL